MKDITYYIYHIPGKKIGVTTNLKSRVEDQQGYGPGEYEILARRHDISEAAKYEAMYQRMYGYPVDIVPYDKLNCNKNKQQKKQSIKCSHCLPFRFSFFIFFNQRKQF